ncbi:MAG: aminotransferase class I/II-fold pyridoxal phosphate-dependent enzyme [Candidatus Promineofilum sp.]|nr:aminotransferase class I/II-fold pyridoxal phosphate-dependent enzyme [Promineifilum sp.]
MHIAPFATEQYFSLYEFATPHILCASDCETTSVGGLLRLAKANADDLLNLRLGYTESAGDPALRAAVAALYESVAPDEVVGLGAPEEGIYLTMRALLEPGDHVIVLTPAYDSLINLADHVSGNISRWPLRARPDGWALDLDELDRLITAETRLVVVNFPHNPTGYLPDATEFEALIDIVRPRGSWLLCDEMYRGLERDPAQRLPSAADRYERAVTLSGLSKTYGLPGLRTGWLVVRDAAVRAALINWKHYTTICAAAPSEALAIVALGIHEQLAARSRGLITTNLGTAGDFFGRWPAMFDWRPPRAGSVALIGLEASSATDYCHALARDAGVLLLPGPCLGANDHSVRFGFGRAGFGEALAAYEHFLENGN